ncbi:hypothetical protein KPH14_009562 [Odynerus spinipes]|uniref:Uncharacterized protein n=1 Tax=Odynerus spinipes TaxID=1348599 RepID=A0AAD9VR36_9HYME|nr:hypothetical protein KPH14_009562 [Odynerus spinipes]
MKFYLLAALLFVAMMAVMSAPVEEEHATHAVEPRANRQARTSCTILGVDTARVTTATVTSEKDLLVDAETN